MALLTRMLARLADSLGADASLACFVHGHERHLPSVRGRARLNQTIREGVRYLSQECAAMDSQTLTVGNRIATEKLRTLGMTFGGQPLPEATIRQLVTSTHVACSS
jgi:hypothetical protein